jgi:hypothetical protein
MPSSRRSAYGEHYLDGSALPIDVVTDHKNLEYFATTKVLNCTVKRAGRSISASSISSCGSDQDKLGTKLQK